MKHLIISLLIVFTSTSAFAAAPDCSFLTDSIFVCHYDGTSGLEIFEESELMTVEPMPTDEEGLFLNAITSPTLIGFDFEIKNCVSEAFGKEAKATCFLNKSKLSTARPVPQKTVIKRVDVR